MRKLLVLLALAALLPLAYLTTRAADPDEGWKAVNEAIEKGLPKTAIEKLNPLIERAVEQKKYAEAIKAISMKIALEGNIQGNKPEEKITRMKEAIDKAPAEMKPMMQAIIANWYWHYYQQNRWRFMQRTETETAPSDDFTTWSLPRLFDEIGDHFEKALASAEQLKKIPVSEYDELLEKGTAPDSYRPTLFDFVAYDAIQFYAAGEQAGARAQDAFDLLASSPIFAPVDGFLDWMPETTDEDSPTLRAIQLYQALLRFHEDDDDRSAFLDADLARLTFGHNQAFGSEKDARYIAALKRFYDQHTDHPISARAIHEHAQVVHNQGDYVQARQLAMMGMNRFPDSIGGHRCYNLIQQIEARSASARTERVWSTPAPTIDVTYRNVDKIYFRIVPYNFENWIKSSKQTPEQLSQAERVTLLRRESVKSWSHDLEPTEDYKERTVELESPEGLEPGSYYLVASHNPQFTAADNQISFVGFWVSDLAIVVRTHNGDAYVDGFVLNAITGEPLAGAKVRAWMRGNRGQREPLPATQTDENGLFRFNQAGQALLLHASHGDQGLASYNQYYMNKYDRTPRPSESVVFFTDRSIYRPGQTIRYKGVAVFTDQRKNKYEVISGRSVTVTFLDVNGEEIARQTHRTNDYGSLNGSFTAPRDRVMGQMSIRVDGAPQGYAAVTVEEYKRPKFQVKFEPPTESPRLNEEVTVPGKATAYTGAAIDNAKVSWRVMRNVRYPVWYYWRYWWMPSPPTNSQEIAHGVTTTDAQGNFSVSFTALPDLSVPESSEPTFNFEVYADVTDTTGETRSDQRSINVGYVALQASLSADDWQTTQQPVTVKIHTSTLDGEGQSAKGTVKIYSLKAPEQVHRPQLQEARYYRNFGMGEKPEPDLSNPNSWPLDEVVMQHDFQTDGAGNAQFEAELKEGAYRAKLETTDRFGKTVEAELPLTVVDPTADDLDIPVPFVFQAPEWQLEPGQQFKALWGTGYDEGRAFVEIEHRGRILESYWTDPEVTQTMIEHDVNENLRGGFTVRVTMVRENRAHLETRGVTVPWSNKDLTLAWERFTNKLKPADQETWTAVIKGPDAEKAVAELVATLYDASLDAYLPHQWQQTFGMFYIDYTNVSSQFENQLQSLHNIYHGWGVNQKDGTLTYRQLPQSIVANLSGYMYFSRGRRNAAFGRPQAARMMLREADQAEGAAQGLGAPAAAKLAAAGDMGGEGRDAEPAKQIDLDNVSARQNLNETAFFFPHVVSGEDGTVRLEFTMPEALTEWKFMGFAHDQKLRSGFLQDSVVTAKDLMVQPNAPRFVREGDAIHFTVKVSNQSPTRQTGAVRLTFSDARTNDSVDSLILNEQLDQEFDIPSKESRTLSWEIQIPDDLGVLTYKAVGSTGKLSDGEQGFLPVLSRRILVTESLPLPIRGPETKEFDFDRLQLAGQSDTLKHQSLTVQVASNPSWYAVMALPYLMEFPYECTEQTFNRLYANSLARHIATSDPKIERIFEQWRGTEALDSPLQKNEDLKSVMIEETPWLRDAIDESQARRNVGILFDQNRLNDETRRLLNKLAQQQLEDGRWPWFPGGPPNDFITLYITTGFGRLRHLGVEVDVSSAVSALDSLDAWADIIYRRILERGDKDKNHLTATIALYLYGRSFFLNDKPIGDQHREAVDYWLSQAKEYWLELGIRQSQGHLAVALKRFGDPRTAQAIMRSIKERSVTDEELGMFWRDTELSYWWYRAPIETQALMIEAFDEVMNDIEAVEECKVWLLKQKQTQDWKTTKATADAVYALLLRGSDVLASDALVQVTLGGLTIKPEDVEAGTGFYQQRFVGPEIEPEMGNITLKKVDEGVAWGSVHWQYLEDMSKVQPYDGTPLKLAKSLYKKVNTKDGPKLQAVEGAVEVGDELVTRVVLRVDRDMEYVHLKDYRGSGTEPVNVLSRYKYQDGLAYYESTRDTASHFFIDYLPKGTYVFEYSVRVQLKGEYQTGIAEIQCMYAPEFNSHSESVLLKVE